MKAVSVLAVGLVGLLALPGDAQKRQADRRVPVDVSIAGGGGGPSTIGIQVGRSCIQRILDQANGGCLQASSTPTNGLLLPYPGIDNTFTAPALVAGGERNVASGARAFVGGGYDNVASGYRATIGGGYRNDASGIDSTVGGGGFNDASADGATIGGGGGNDASGADSTISGGRLNTAGGPLATVGGGSNNNASELLSTIGGGYANFVSGRFATIGGGYGNSASGSRATISGGKYNYASELLATIGGGYENCAFGAFASIGGGVGNRAAAYYATVPGGSENSAEAAYSFAAGRRAKAEHTGAFVWGDSIDGDKTSSVADEFNVYASGGARFFSNTAATTGVLLAPGGGSWTAVSDRAAKENVEPVDARAVLEKVARLPLSTWNYKEQADSIRHMGPMAQDFYAAFRLGLGETTIDTIDPDGVALAAIQGLHAQMTELRAENEELRERLGRLEELTRAVLSK